MKEALCTITGIFKNDCFVVDGYGVEENDNADNAFYSKKGDRIPNNPKQFIDNLKNRALNELGCAITVFKVLRFDANTKRFEIIKEWNEPIPTLH